MSLTKVLKEENRPSNLQLIGNADEATFAHLSPDNPDQGRQLINHPAISHQSARGGTEDRRIGGRGNLNRERRHLRIVYGLEHPEMANRFGCEAMVVEEPWADRRKGVGLAQITLRPPCRSRRTKLSIRLIPQLIVHEFDHLNV